MGMRRAVWVEGPVRASRLTCSSDCITLVWTKQSLWQQQSKISCSSRSPVKVKR